MLMPAWFSEWRPLSDHWDLTYATANIALHAALLVIHLLLAIDLSYHLEHRISAVAGLHARILSLSTTAVSQLIALIFTAVLVVMTQQLALRRDLYDRATATVLHDKSSAWLGLMSSLLAIYHQTRLRTAAVPIMLVFLYLAGITVIHTTTPILFSNVNALLPLDAASHQLPSSTTVTPVRSLVDKALTTHTMFRHFRLLLPPDMGRWRAWSPYGWLPSTLFDIPSGFYYLGSRDHPGHIELGTVSFLYKCGVVREATVVNSTEDGYIAIDMAPLFGRTHVSLTTGLAPIAIVRAMPYQSSLGEDASETSTLNMELPWIVVVDANITNDCNFGRHGHVPCSLSLQKPIHNELAFQMLGGWTEAVSVFACSLSLEDGKRTGNLPFAYDDGIGPQHEPVDPADPFYVAEAHDGDAYANWLLSLVPSGDTAALRALCPDPTRPNVDVVNDACLGYTVFADAAFECMVRDAFDLRSLGGCLGLMTSYLAWAGSWITSRTLDENSPGSYVSPIEWFSIGSTLQINALPVYIGLGTSAVLFVIAYLLTWPRRDASGIDKNLKSPGILQITWLLGKSDIKMVPTSVYDVVQVRTPELFALRKAGAPPEAILAAATQADK